MVHALYQRRPVRVGEIVVVQDSGPVGLAAAAQAQLAGAAQAIVVGGPSHRLSIAARTGLGDQHVNIVDVPAATEVLAEVVALTGGRGADLVIECTGRPRRWDGGSPGPPRRLVPGRRPVHRPG